MLVVAVVFYVVVKASRAPAERLASSSKLRAIGAQESAFFCRRIAPVGE